VHDGGIENGATYLPLALFCIPQCTIIWDALTWIHKDHNSCDQPWWRCRTSRVGICLNMTLKILLGIYLIELMWMRM